MLYYRDIADRAQKALPFLQFDRDPYLVIAADGTLKWILDGYTTSDDYPYAQRLRDGTNYMRNSVKLVIDAYDGSLTAYLSAPADPVIRTWARIFPGIFAPAGQHAGRPAGAPPVPGRHLPGPDQPLHDLSHGCAG